MATEHYIGAFGITDRIHPRFYGFWELPESITVSGMAVQNGIVYLTSGNALYILNTAEQSPFAIKNQVRVTIYYFSLRTRKQQYLYQWGYW